MSTRSKKTFRRSKFGRYVKQRIRYSNHLLSARKSVSQKAANAIKNYDNPEWVAEFIAKERALAVLTRRRADDRITIVEAELAELQKYEGVTDESGNQTPA